MDTSDTERGPNKRICQEWDEPVGQPTIFKKNSAFQAM